MVTTVDTSLSLTVTVPIVYIGYCDCIIRVFGGYLLYMYVYCLLLFLFIAP